MSHRKIEHHSILPKGCSRGPKLGTYSDWGLFGVWLLINIYHIINLSGTVDINCDDDFLYDRFCCNFYNVLMTFGILRPASIIH